MSVADFKSQLRYGWRRSDRRGTILFPAGSRERPMQGPYGQCLKLLPKGPIYLYLGEASWSEPWIDGGKIPLFAASKYLSSERAGTQTPDELKHFRWDGADPSDFAGVISIEGMCQDIQIHNCSINGKAIPSTRIDNYIEDAYVFCASTVASLEIQSRLGKVCCIEVTDGKGLVNHLEAVTDKEIFYGPVRYTADSERSHFMKSVDDQWMSEYRIIIPKVDKPSLELQLPPNIGKLFEIS